MIKDKVYLNDVNPPSFLESRLFLLFCFRQKILHNVLKVNDTRHINLDGTNGVLGSNKVRSKGNAVNGVTDTIELLTNGFPPI